MDNRNRLSKLYTTESDLDRSNDEDGQLEKVVDANQRGKNRVAT
jgi:hypothetical protein